ncbi:MAG TPA: RICIN domain-containing protein [Fibrobacter sp.]|nr:RICIN domain-containing protein [Fibrobacter sp.]
MKKSLISVAFFVLSVATAWGQGNITYTLQKAANPNADQVDAYAKIQLAMDSALFLYNKHTTLSKKITVYYDTGVSTAQANFDGVISFGPSRSYMMVITAMHEMGHVFGVGTTSQYVNTMVNGVFTGPQATAKIKEISGDPTAVIHGDNTHFWPYGLNYVSEVSSEQDLIRHCLIVDAIYKDLFREEVYFAGTINASDGRCITRIDNSLSLGDCEGPKAQAKIIQLGEKVPYTYRLEFGDLVIDIPNEKTTPNVEVGLYSWNGKNHQRFILESNQDGLVRIKMVHSGLFLEASTDRLYQMTGNEMQASQWWQLKAMGSQQILINTTLNLKGKSRLVDLKGRVVHPQEASTYQKTIPVK